MPKPHGRAATPDGPLASGGGDVGPSNTRQPLAPPLLIRRLSLRKFGEQEKEYDIEKDFDLDWSRPALPAIDISEEGVEQPSALEHVLTLTQAEEIDQDIVESFDTDWNKAVPSRSLRLEVVRAFDLLPPQYGPLDRLNCCAAPTMSAVYGSLQLGAMRGTTGLAAGGRGAGCVSFGAERSPETHIFEYAAEDALWVTIAEKRSAPCFRQPDPIIGTGMLNLLEQNIRDGEAHSAKVHLLRDGRAAGCVELKFELVDTSTL